MPQAVSCADGGDDGFPQSVSLRVVDDLVGHKCSDLAEVEVREQQCDDDLRCGNGGLAAQNERRWRRGSGGVVLSYLDNRDGKLRGSQWVQKVIRDSGSEIVDLENLEERLAPKFRAVRDEERLFGD